MASDFPSLTDEVRAELARYLHLLPAESSSLQALQLQLDEEGEAIFPRSNMRGHITTSALVLNQDATKALLIHHGLYNRWLQPGGHFELPGNLWDSAQREVLEETGVHAELHPWCRERDVVFDIDTHAIPAQARKNEGPHWHHDFVYLAVADEGELTPQLEEVHGAAWTPLSELRQLNTVRMNRMLDKLETVLGRAVL